MTLLEVMIATAMMSTIVATVAVLLRGSHAAWNAQDEDLTRLRSAHATVRHIVRHVRQATAVAAISNPSNTAGSLSITTASGDTYVWARNGNTDEVQFGIGTADQLLAEDITELTFTGYQADATTTTTEPSQIQSVRCTARVTLPHDVGGERTVSAWVWMRTW